jgi:hypothetical protein
MNEAPKKIWRVEQNGYASGPDVLYIRADLVDGLIEALEQLLDDMGDSGLSVCPAAKEQARAALKALEEADV